MHTQKLLCILRVDGLAEFLYNSISYFGNQLLQLTPRSVVLILELFAPADNCNILLVLLSSMPPDSYSPHKNIYLQNISKINSKLYSTQVEETLNIGQLIRNHYSYALDCHVTITVFNHYLFFSTYPSHYNQKDFGVFFIYFTPRSRFATRIREPAVPRYWYCIPREFVGWKS